MENPIKIDDLGVPLFLETPIWFSNWQTLNSKHFIRSLCLWNLLGNCWVVRFCSLKTEICNTWSKCNNGEKWKVGNSASQLVPLGKYFNSMMSILTLHAKMRVAGTATITSITNREQHLNFLRKIMETHSLPRLICSTPLTSKKDQASAVRSNPWAKKTSQRGKKKHNNRSVLGTS